MSEAKFGSTTQEVKGAIEEKAGDETEVTATVTEVFMFLLVKYKLFFESFSQCRCSVMQMEQTISSWDWALSVL